MSRRRPAGTAPGRGSAYGSTCPRELRHASWFGTGPNESYPDTRLAARVGRFAADIDELNVAYSRPQETGHRSELRELVISDAEAPRLSVTTWPNEQLHRPGFTLSAYTPQQLDRARHPYELVRGIMSTCSSTTQCMGSAHAPAAWTYSPSTRCGRAPQAEFWYGVFARA